MDDSDLKLVSRWAIIIGVAITGMGAIHAGLSQVMYQNLVYEGMPTAIGISFMVAWLFMGAALVFLGVLNVYVGFGLQQKFKWAWALGVMIGLFMIALSSIAFTLYFMGVSQAFGWVLLVMGVLALAPLWVYREAYMRKKF
jgi:hypothetical protein